MAKTGDADQMRQELMQAGLNELQMPADPFVLFDEWLSFAFEAGIYNANAMALATAADSGQPSVRNVLARQISPASASPVVAAPAASADSQPTWQHGIAFFTDTTSRKGQELRTNSQVEALFSWLIFERQLRITGSVIQLHRAAIEENFATRHPDSQAVMHASNQSAPVADRSHLQRRLTEIQADQAASPLDAPASWSGYLLVPTRFEFWQGRTSRLHDRLIYEPVSELSDESPTTWKVSRLQP